MLAEHLNQAHDGASRRFENIDQQVAWIHRTLLSEAPTSLLDLGCGPGLYTERLGTLGHTCHGIDFGPASIQHARETAQREDLPCSYDLGDLRSAPFGSGYGLALFLFGEPSVFSSDQLRSILSRAARALAPGGQILLEPHTEHGVAAIGDEPNRDDTMSAGLFLDAPHTLTSSTEFDAATGVATRQWVVTPADSSVTTTHLAWYQAYSNDVLRALLAESGFVADSVTFHSNLLEPADDPLLEFVTAVRAVPTVGISTIN